VDKRNPTALRQLQTFVGATQPLIDKVEFGYGTQLSEAVNGMVAHACQKLKSYGISGPVRSATAVLDFSCGRRWRLWGYDQLARKYHWSEIPRRMRALLMAEFEKSEHRSEQRRQPEAQKKANATRRARKTSQAAKRAAAAKRGAPLYGSDDDDDVVDRDSWSWTTTRNPMMNLVLTRRLMRHGS
jgi:hypothetical protein